MTGWWSSPGTPVSSIKKTDRHDITEILLKVTLNILPLSLYYASRLICSQICNYYFSILCMYPYLSKRGTTFSDILQFQIRSLFVPDEGEYIHEYLSSLEYHAPYT